MEEESSLEKFQRISGIYALKTFSLGFLFILIGIILTFFSDNKLFYIVLATGFFIVLWAISEGKRED